MKTNLVPIYEADPKTFKQYDVYLNSPNSMGRPFCGRWITVKARNRQEAKREASLSAGINIGYVKTVREITE